ncbi:hypothetical protein V8U11_06710 [Pseudomonas chlororaphis]|uniref:DUF7210 family protein n=1 Tax=Pseudomonas chlororaphis TaxID=587753 RepID=UPI0030D06C5F
MKLITLKPLLLGGQVVVEGQSFETHEQHGRELVTKGYAALDRSDAEPVVKLEEEPVEYSLTLTSNQLVPPQLSLAAAPLGGLLDPPAPDAPDAPDLLDPPAPDAPDAPDLLDPPAPDEPEAPQKPATSKKKAS